MNGKYGIHTLEFQDHKILNQHIQTIGLPKIDSLIIHNQRLLPLKP